MPFGICYAPATFQRCMISIFSDMIEHFIKVFMDDFSVFGSSFDDYLVNLIKFAKMQGEEFDSKMKKMSFYGKEGNRFTACNFT